MPVPWNFSPFTIPCSHNFTPDLYSCSFDIHSHFWSPTHRIWLKSQIPTDDISCHAQSDPMPNTVHSHNWPKFFKLVTFKLSQFPKSQVSQFLTNFDLLTHKFYPNSWLPNLAQSVQNSVLLYGDHVPRTWIFLETTDNRWALAGEITMQFFSLVIMTAKAFRPRSSQSLFQAISAPEGTRDINFPKSVMLAGPRGFGSVLMHLPSVVLFEKRKLVKIKLWNE